MSDRYNVDAEKSVLSSVLMSYSDGLKSVFDILQADDFYVKSHIEIYKLMKSIHDQGKIVDVVTLASMLDTDMRQYVMDMLQEHITSAGWEQHAEEIRDCATDRILKKVSNDLLDEFSQGKVTWEEYANKLEGEIKRISTERSNRKSYTKTEDIVLDVLREIEKNAENGGVVSGLSTGFDDVDRLTTGLHPQELVLVAARPAMGKTAFVLNIAQKIAEKETVAFFSLEMSKEQLIQRVMSSVGLVDAQKLRTGDLSDSEWDKVIEASGVVSKSKLIINDKCYSISDIRNECRKLKEHEDVKLIMIDYLQLMVGDRKDSRQQEVSEMSRALKLLARELDVPIICLSQLSRAVEARQDHRPMLSDLRESGAIEQDADVVMFLYRDEYYNPSTTKSGIAEVIIAKQRAGSTGTIELVWLGQYTKFANKEKWKSIYDEGVPHFNT